MTLTALLVLTAGLATGKAGPAVPFATQALEAQPPTATLERRLPVVTCTLKVIHAPAGLDAGILAPPPRNVFDRIVHDSVSPCERP
jgi:hypothetical protein